MSAGAGHYGTFSARVNSVKGSTLTMRLAPSRFAISTPMRGMVPPGYIRKRRGSFRIYFRCRQDCKDAIAGRQIEAARILQIRRARDQDVVFGSDPHFDHLFAAAGAVDGGIEEVHDLIRHRAQAQGFDTRRGAGIADAGDERDQRQHDQHLDQRDAGVIDRPRLLIAPADNVGVVPFSAGLAVGAQRNDVGLIAMIAGEFVEIRMAPGIVGTSFGRYGPAH